MQSRNVPGDRIQKVGAVGGDERRAGLRERTASGPSSRDLLDRTAAVRVDSASDLEGMQQVETCMDGNKLRYLRRYPKWLECWGDVKPNSQSGRARVW